MGLFSRDYSKPGKGVDKNEPQKKAFFRFFELVGRKFFQLVGYNFFYFVLLLPIIVAAYNFFYSWLYAISGIEETPILPVLADFFRVLYTFVPEVLHIPLLVVSLVLYGPFTMGLTYCLRNFVREEHAWMSDFFSRAFSNFKQGLFFGILDAVILFIFYCNWNYSAMMGEETMSVISIIIRVVTTVAFVYYLFMRNYFYQQAVTINLGVGHIIKNAAIFGIVGLWRNILAVLLTAAVVVVATILHPLVELLAVPLIMFSLAGFAAVFCTYPITDKYIVQPARKEAGLDPERKGRDEDLPPAVLPPELGGPGAGAHTEYLEPDEPETPADSSDETNGN